MGQDAKTILITGSSGMIGTRLTERLLEGGRHRIIGIDWRPNVWNQSVNQITVQRDLRYKANFHDLPWNIDMVIHLAANARVYNLVKDPQLARDNFETTFNVLDFARVRGIKKFILASSRETYGNSGKVIHEEHEAYTQNCESPYTASKIGGEALTQAFYQCYGMEFLIFRLSNVYGMYDGSDRVIPQFIQRASQQRDLVVYGREKILDFTYIDDCIAGFLRGIEHFETAKNDVYNIASGEGVPLVRVAHLIQESMGRVPSTKIQENRTGEVVRFIADISKAKRQLQYSPEVNIEEGIRRSVEWYVGVNGKKSREQKSNEAMERVVGNEQNTKY